MTNRSEISLIRTIVPVGLGVAIGLAIGAAALANAPAAKTEMAPKAAVSTQLSSQPGIRFARTNDDGARCFKISVSRSAETLCQH